MSQMIGADVEALRRLALQFDQSGQRLRGIAGSVSNGVQVSAWVGPVALRFRHTWDSEHSVRLRTVADALDANAKLLRQNADQQEAASASLAGNAGVSVVAKQRAENDAARTGPRSPVDAALQWLKKARDVVDPLVGLGQIASDFRLQQLAYFKGTLAQLARPASIWGAIARPLGVIGGALGVLKFGEGVVGNDPGKRLVGGIGIISSKLPLPLRIAAGAATAYGSATLPVTNEEISGAYDHTLRRRFPNYDPANPTQQEAEWGMKRYEGPMGFLNSISDGMDYKLRWMRGNR